MGMQEMARIKQGMQAEKARAEKRVSILKERAEALLKQVLSRRALVKLVESTMPKSEKDINTALSSHPQVTQCLVRFALGYADIASADADMYELTLHEMLDEQLMLTAHVEQITTQLNSFSDLIVPGVVMPVPQDPRKN
jgi:hypothetical protein